MDKWIKEKGGTNEPPENEPKRGSAMQEVFQANYGGKLSTVVCWNCKKEIENPGDVNKLHTCPKCGKEFKLCCIPQPAYFTQDPSPITFYECVILEHKGMGGGTKTGQGN